MDSVRVIVKGMKKDRIYDFKELKSLFPASSVDAGIRAKAVIPGDPEGGKRHAGEKTGNGLSRPGHYSVRPGTRVVLMDSNLKGRILSAGRNVRIELEEGLVIDAEYGEFAVSDPEEEKLLSDSSIVSGAKVCPTARSGTAPFTTCPAIRSPLQEQGAGPVTAMREEAVFRRRIIWSRRNFSQMG